MREKCREIETGESERRRERERDGLICDERWLYNVVCETIEMV